MATLSIVPRSSRPYLTRQNHALAFFLQCRLKHTQTRNQHTVTTADPALPISHDHVSSIKKARSPLSMLPLPTLLRSWAITSISSYPPLLTPALKLMSFIAHSSSPILNPDRNPILHFLLKKTFYAQFCAGETPKEVQATAQQLRDMGFKGVILAYGKEIVLEKGEKAKLLSKSATYTTEPCSPEEQAANSRDVAAWKSGTLATVNMTQEGDFVALKFSGAGKDTMRQLAGELPPSPEMEAAMVKICDLAHSKGVGLLFDAEQDAVQPGIDAWTLEFQQRYNKQKAVVYGTYQAYLRSAPSTVAKHLAAAKQGNFTLGLKLVRGAYMASDPRHVFWPTKEATDTAYDGIVDALIRQSWNTVLQPPPSPTTTATSDPTTTTTMPPLSLVLATHNPPSVQKCMRTRRALAHQNLPNITMAYGQLKGMADDLSGELVLAAQTERELVERDERLGSNTYKYLVWGSVGECLKYLCRRAEENRGAVGGRTKGGGRALGGEVWRRCFG